MDPLVPLPAPLPPRWWASLLALVVTAWLLLLPELGTPGGFPGDPQLPSGPATVEFHWQLHARGLASLLADDLHGFPARTDRVVTEGVPLDAYASWPLCTVLGEQAGMWAWAWTTLWAVGAAAAWLGMRWWGTPGAGLVAGVGFQVGEAGLREVAAGRTTTTFAAIFLPFALGLALFSARTGRARDAAGAGVAAGLGTLASWGLGPVFALAAFGPAILRRRSVGVVTLAAFVAVVAPAVAWVAAGRGELPSLGLDPWSEAVIGATQARPVDLGARAVYGTGGVALGTLARPLLLAAGAWTVLRSPLRFVAAPAAAACGCLILGLGAWLPGPVVLPWGWLQSVGDLGRMWWPDRAWIGVSLGLAVLAAGVPKRAALLGAGLLFVEARALSPSLPFGRIPLGETPAAQVLARAPDVPFVLLPTGGGPLRTDRADLVDQVWHGRPMANGTRPALDLTASDAELRMWRENPGLRALFACETGGAGLSDADRAAAGTALARAGLREVYLDPKYASDPAYGACVEGVLAGWERGEEPPLVRYRLDR